MKRLLSYALICALMAALTLCPAAAAGAEGPQPGPLPERSASAAAEQDASAVNPTTAARYFLPNLGQATTAKIQTPWGACWAFAAAGAVESSILKAEVTLSGQAQALLPADSPAFAAPDLTALATTPDLSERAIGWFAHEPQTEASGGAQAGEGFALIEPSAEEQLSGGNFATAASALTAWQTLTLEAGAPYQYNGYVPGESHSWYGTNPAFDARLEDWSLPDAVRTAEDAGWRVSEVLRLQSPANASASGEYTGYTAQATDAIKRTLVNVGGVAVALSMEQNIPADVGNGNHVDAAPSESFTFSTWSQFDAASIPSQNHAALIVGWDDAYPASSFQGTESGQPPADGAWLCKNSWGNDELFASLGGADEASRWGIVDANGQASGYFWLSYYDHTIADLEAFAVTPADETQELYQYDYLGAAEYVAPVKYDGPVQAANVFTAESTELVEAVTGWTFAPDTACALTVGTLPYGFDAANAAPDEVMAASTPVAHAAAVFADAGFHTLQLDTPVLVSEGQAFTITLQIAAEPGGFDVERSQLAEGAASYLGLEVAYVDGGVNGQTTGAHAVANPGETFVNATGRWQAIPEVNAERAAAREQHGQEPDFTYGNAITKAIAVPTTMAAPERIYQVLPLTAS